MAKFNPLSNLLKKKQKDILNQYDNGSIWSKPIEEEEPINNALLKITNPSGFAPLGSVLSKKTSNIVDPLESPRNQIDYYTNQLNSLGIDPVAPKIEEKKSGLSGVLNVLDKVFAVPNAVGNFMAGYGDKVTEQFDEKLTKVKDAYDDNGLVGGTLEFLNPTDLLKNTFKDNAGVAGLKSAYKTLEGSWFNEDAKKDVVDFGKAIDNTGKSENLKVVEDVLEKYINPVYGVSKFGFGADEEKAREWGNLGADLTASILTGKVSDLDNVGKGLKYLNKADEIDDIAKVANNTDEAMRLAKESVSFDDFKKSYEITANKLKKSVPSDDAMEELYSKHLDTYANKLMKDTTKALGGLDDFKGITVGNNVLISKDSLKKISQNKIQKALLEGGLSLYSPIGALTKGYVPTKLGEVIEKTETGKGFKNDFNKIFTGGSNNEWVNTAKKSFEEGDTDNVMSAVNRKTESKLYKTQKEIGQMYHVMNAEKYAKNLDNDSAIKVTTAIEGEKETITKEIESEMLNPAYVKETKKKLDAEFEKMSNEILSDTSGNKAKDLVELNKLKAEIDEIENLPKSMSINFSEQLKTLGVKGNRDMFRRSLEMDLDALTKHLESKGVDNAYEVAKKLKTASNNVIDNIEEKLPMLSGKFKGRKNFNLRNDLGLNYEADTFSNEGSTVLSRRRERLVNKIKENGYELTDKHRKEIDSLDNEGLLEYEKIVNQKDMFRGQEKLFTTNNEEYKNFFKSIGIDAPEDLKEGLDTIFNLRKLGYDTPYFKYKDYGEDVVGKTRKLNEIESTKRFIKHKLSSEELTKRAKQMMYDSGRQNELKDITSTAQKMLKGFEQDFDTPLKTLQKGLYDYLDSKGIKLSPIEKKAITDSPDKVKEIIERKYLKEFKDTIGRMNDSEVDLYFGTINNKKLPPISDVTLKQEAIDKIKNTDMAWSSKDMAINTDDGFDLAEDIKKRESWSGEQVGQVEQKEYTGDLDGLKANKDLEASDRAIQREAEKREINNIVDDMRERGNVEVTDDEANQLYEAIFGKSDTATYSDVIKATEEIKVSKTPIIEPTVKEEVVVTNHTLEEPNKPVETASVDKRAGKFTGLEFELEDGRKVIIDENISNDDLEKVITDNLVANKYVYTNNMPMSGRYNNKNVILNTNNPKGHMNDIKTHEETHYVQDMDKDNFIGGKEAKEFMTNLPEADDDTITKLNELFNITGYSESNEALIRNKFLTKYLYNVKTNKTLPKDNVIEQFERETDAVLSMTILSDNPRVSELATEIFGKDIYKTYIERISKYSDNSKFENVKGIVRTKATDELYSKLDSLKKSVDIISKAEKLDIATKQKRLVELGEAIESIEKSEDNLNNILSNLEKNGAIGSIKGINKHIKVKTYVDEVIDKDLASELSKEEFEAYSEIKKYFADFGKKEGIVKEGEEDLFSNYVFHMLNPKLKANKEAFKIAKDKFGQSIGDIFNGSSISRSIEGTIKDINKSFKETLNKQGLEEMDLFESNIVDIYLKRALNHENVMYNTKKQNRFLEEFGTKDIKNFQKEIDTEDNIRKYMTNFFNREGITDYDMKKVVSDFKESNKTAYNFLIENSKDYGIKKVFEDEIRDLNGETFAKETVRTRFKTNDDINTLDTDYVVYEKGKQQRLMSEEEQLSTYKQKLESVERLKAQGMSDKSFKDNRAIAKNKGLKYIDNSMVRVETSEILSKEQKALRFKSNEELYEWRRLRGQEVRRELREKYKKDNTVHFAFNDVEVNYQKAYREMTDNMLRNGDYVVVAKNNGKTFTKTKTVGKDVEINELEGLSDYSVIDNSAIRNKTFMESNEDYYIFKQDHWNAYKKELDRQMKIDTNSFLKAYDKASELFKSMALASGRFVSNSAFGNFFESYMTAGVNLTNPKMVKNFIKYKSGKDFEINGHSITEIKNAMDNFGVTETEVANEFTNSELYKRIANVKGENLNPLQKIAKKTNIVNPISKDFFAYKGTRIAQNEIEEMSRFINVMTHLDNGKSMAEAINLTNRALFDYSDLTDFEVDKMKRIIPFYTFMRKNMPLQLENMANRPAKYGRLVGAYDKANDMNTEKERALRPDYLDNAFSLGNGKFLNLPNPILDLERLIKPSQMVQGLNPIIKTPIELILNKQMYSGADISKYDKGSEKAKYAVDSMLPLFKQYKGALDKAKEGDFTGIANLSGVPVKKFDTATAEKQTMYEYVTQLENQYYELLEKYPELKEKLADIKEAKKEANANKYTSNKKFSPLSSLINK